MKRRILEDKARQLRAEGHTYPAIADELGVNEKTVRRWLGGPGERALAKDPLPGWPADRLWPNWSAEELGIKIGWTGAQAAEEEATVRIAQEMGNLHYPWYIRRIVELAERYGASHRLVDQKKDPWVLAIAGLPVLSDWLSCPECDQLATLIERYEPWQSKKARHAYNVAASSLVDSIQLAMLNVMTSWRVRSGQSGLGLRLTESPHLLLHALEQRIPLFDRRPLLSPFRLYKMQHLFSRLFIFPKGV
jgi:hypothetical protein